MPIYTYQCDACEYAWEDLIPYEKILVATQEPCPKCQERKVSRIIEMPPINYSGKSIGARTPDGFKDVLTKVKNYAGKTKQNKVNDFR
jgi:putative FmdB family regulatory protein